MTREKQILFQWKSPLGPRAKSVPPEKWERHREELWSLYQRMTLDDLMAMMKVRHSFTPSRRQYIHQFQKWHFNKYNINSGRTELGSAQSHTLSPQPAHPLFEKGEHTCEGGGPSHMLVRSDRATKRAQSLCEKPPVPPKKRKLLADFLSAKDPDAQFGLAFDSAKDASSSSQGLVPRIKIDDSLVGMPSGLSKRVDSNADSPFGMLIKDACGPTSDSSSDTSMASPSEQSSFWGLVDFEQSQSDDRLVENIFRREIMVDSNRPIDTFSANEIADMKRAADFLKCFHCTEDAFALYILILKWLKVSIDQSACMRLSVMILCAHCARTAAHIEIVRGLLHQHLNETQSPFNDIEKFLFRMLLAQTHIRIKDDATAKSHINAALSANSANGDLITCLPREYRIFDIITYHYLTGGLTFHLKDELLPWRPKYVEKKDAQQLLLRNTPGPFELRDGSMRNPCLKSCLQWVVAELKSMPSLSSSLQLGKTKGKNVGDIAEVLAIFCNLWERSQNRQTKNKDATCLIWMDQTERLMGISAAELLRTVCSLIIQVSPTGKKKSPKELVSRAYLGAVSLRHKPDELLGCKFLEEFSSSRSIGKVSAEQKAFRSVLPAYGKEFIGQKLWIRLPNVLRNALEAPSRRQGLDIVAAALLPTIASSLHSSELASFRMIRDRMQRNVADAMQGVKTAISSRVSKTSARSNRSFPTISMSELSQALSSSLNLSSTG